jgi:choline transport protein
LAIFVILTITCLARSEKQSSTYVWTNFESETGWPPVVSFLTELITPRYMYAGLDATLHLAEVTRRPEKVVPLALVSTIGIGFTTFVFSVSMSYTITDLESLLNDS